MLNLIIGILHILIGIIISFYAFIFPKNFLYDFLYILFIILLLFSWILFENQCVISYYYNKMNNIKNTEETSDIAQIIDPNGFLGKFLFVLTTITMIISFYITASRSNIASVPIIILFLTIRYIYLFYNNAVGYNFKSCCSFFIGEKKYNYFNGLYKKTGIDNLINSSINQIIFSVNLFIFIYVIYINRKRVFLMCKF